MSGLATGWAKKQDAPCRASKSLLVMLADYADENQFAWPAVGTLAGETQQSERNVKRLLRKLEGVGLLVGLDVVDRYTRRTRTRAYWFPVFGDEPSAKAIASYEQKVGGRVTPLSPWEGDTTVTLEGDTRVTGRVTTVSPLNEPPLEPLEADASKACARASDVEGGEAFRTAFGAYPHSGRIRTSDPAARLAWLEAVGEAGGADRLIAAVRAFAADPHIARSDHGAPSFQRWLSEKRFLALLAVDDAPPLARGPVPWRGPPEVRTMVVARQGEGFAAAWLDPADWREADRTVIAATATAARTLAGLGIRDLRVEGPRHGAGSEGLGR